MAAGSEVRPNTGGTCGCCFRAVKWVPVIFILCTVAWSYYAYVVQLCLFTVNSLIEKIVYILAYHFFFAIFMWSYWQTIFTPVGAVPKEFRLPKEERDKLQRATSEQAQMAVVENFAQSLPVTNRTINGAVRYCEKCHHIKPDRAHHCSVCGICILKMDHHCPWVNNCVSFSNYKFFVLFLGYAFLYCIYIVITSLRFFIQFWQGEVEGAGRFHILFLFFVAAMFATSLISLFGYHCYLVLHNRSTLEAFRAPIFRSGPDKDGFNLGKYTNFLQVFGDKKSLWLLPVFTSLGDGVSYPVRSDPETVYNSVCNTSNRFWETENSHAGLMEVVS